MKICITGTSSGFGRHMVSEFLRRDHEVIATLRNSESRKNLFANDLTTYTGRLHIVEQDVTKPQDALSLANYVKNKWGDSLDVLINNAGYGQVGPLEEVSDEELREQFNVNFFGVVSTTKALLPALRKAHGKIINISSILGLMSLPMNGAYCASKFALEGYSEALHYELSPHGVQVTLVEPGGFRTQFAQNMVWSNGANTENSPYHAQIEKFKHIQKARLSKPGANPASVAAKVVNLTEQKRLPLRMVVGADAKSLKLFRTVLPPRLFSAILGKQFAPNEVAKDARQ